MNQPPDAQSDPSIAPAVPSAATPDAPRQPALPPGLPKEIGGTDGPEPTRYGDWEHKGRCTDF